MKTPQGQFNNDEALSLGDWKWEIHSFPNLDALFQEFQTPDFKNLSTRKRFGFVNQTLLNLIQVFPEPSFLLPAVIEYLDRVNREQCLVEPLTFTLFEFWLNHFSKLSEQENARIRGKIAGKWIPRESYQIFFPIGMNKYFPGTHFVSAHMSPDADTMIASFWGWVDAFATRIGMGQHIWSLPGGPPESPVTLIFQEIFGIAAFSVTARTAMALTLSAIDLVTQKNFAKEIASTAISTLDHGSNEKAVILVDGHENYLGDWRSTDVELVRQIVILFKACLRWYENRLHTLLISLFANETVRLNHIDAFLSEILNITFEMSDPAKDFSVEQKHLLHLFMTKGLKIPQGLTASFSSLISVLKKPIGHNLTELLDALAALKTGSLFDTDGFLIENRPKIFRVLETIIQQLNKTIFAICNYVERLDIVMRIKTDVLETPHPYLTMHTDVEEIRLKLKNFDYLTVVIPDENGKFYPLGVVWAHDIRNPILGTVSFRDFCNQDEVKMASYLSIISVVDHHKTSLATNSPPLAIIGDVQSCNVLIAEQSMLLNDRYSLNGMNAESIKTQVHALHNESLSPANLRLSQRLIHRQMALQSGLDYYIHPYREFTEYLTFLHAILDDTDLLTKVSNRDVECVAQLLNRMKSLQCKQEVELVNFDGIPRDQFFAKAAARKILQDPDMYSLYRKSYALREKEVEINLKLGAEGLPSSIFLDTKEQNGCCRVGQTKMFSSNIPTFQRTANPLRHRWASAAQEIFNDRPEVDLHMHMVSTIINAGEVYGNQQEVFKHRDEIWFWIPATQQSQNHLAIFLSAFQAAPEVINNEINLELLGANMEEVEKIFSQNFLALPITKSEQDVRLAVLHFKAGSINSRKSMITPYLPRLLP